MGTLLTKKVQESLTANEFTNVNNYLKAVSEFGKEEKWDRNLRAKQDKIS